MKKIHFIFMFQNQSPIKNKGSNWSPAPEGEYYAMLPAYDPKEGILNKTWEPSAMEIVN